MANTLGAANPLTYRGYVYDDESELYYLQSRYYNPETSRFINADILVSTGQGLLGNNMFAYCLNNPVTYIDPPGTLAISAALIAKLKEAASNGVIAGVVSAACTFSTGGSLTEVLGSFGSAFLQGFAASWIPTLKVVFAVVNAVDTGWQCYSKGVNIPLSLLASGIAFAAGIALGTTNDDVVDAAVDLSFGAGLALISAGTTEGIIRSNGVNDQASRICFDVFSVAGYTVKKGGMAGGGNGAFSVITVSCLC